MRRDEAQLIPAGKETHEDQRVGRIAERAAERLRQTVLKFRAAGRRRAAQQRQEEQAGHDETGKHDEHALPRHHGQKPLRQHGAHHLTGRTRRRRDAQRERALFVRRGTADDGEDDAEPGAGDAETHENLEDLVLARRDGEGREHQPRRIKDRPQHDGAAIPETFRDGAEDRLSHAPGEVLDRDGEAELRPEPAEFLRDGDLEQTEARPDRHAQEQDERPADQDRRQKWGLPCHRRPFPRSHSRAGAGGQTRSFGGNPGLDFPVASDARKALRNGPWVSISKRSTTPAWPKASCAPTRCSVPHS